MYVKFYTLMNMDQKSIFRYYAPKNDLIGVLSIPHSGELVPDDIAPFLVEDFKHLAQDADWRVHQLVDIEALTEAGIAVIQSEIIRTAVDLNRSRDLALLNWKENSKGFTVVKSEPSEVLSETFLGKYYDPYFEVIRTMMEELKNYTNIPNFIDLHSMPSKAEEYHLKKNPKQKIERPDFCLSDQFGKTCSPEYIQFFQTELSKSYPEVTINDPYVGGHITKHIGECYPSGNNIQIEISRAIYMNEINKDMVADKIEILKPILTNTLINGFKVFFKPKKN